MIPKQKIIGITRGVSWESTVLYYKLINPFTREHLGGLNSAKILLYSLIYGPIVELERQRKWRDVQTLFLFPHVYFLLCARQWHGPIKSVYVI